MINEGKGETSGSLRYSHSSGLERRNKAGMSGNVGRRLRVAERGAERASHSDRREGHGTQTKEKPEDQEMEKSHSPSCCTPFGGRMRRGLLSHPGSGISSMPSQEPATGTSGMLPAGRRARLPSLPRPAPKSQYEHGEPFRPSYTSSGPGSFPTHLPDSLPACLHFEGPVEGNKLSLSQIKKGGKK